MSLHKAILTMLDPGSANIAFLRKVFKYGGPGTFHWIDAATPEFMARADGTAVNYADPSQELQSSIWDAGYYIDVMFAALSTRMLMVTTLEPAFRATAHDRKTSK